ncbi:MAG: hypothetical protein J6C61_01610 [Clostridia bacterium]|nr:hypothetical protein [Clostridia bacterium]
MRYKNVRELFLHSSSCRKMFFMQEVKIQEEILKNSEFIRSASQLYYFIDKIKIQKRQEKIATMLF